MDYTNTGADIARGLLLKLCRVPAPSNDEIRRAEFISDWWRSMGVGEVHVDGALNVQCLLRSPHSKRYVAILAHQDTVFPDLIPFEPIVEGDILRCPGAGDNTANLALMMAASRMLADAGLTPNVNLLLVANSGEEGLGNLKGVRAIVEEYGKSLDEVIALDGGLGDLCNSVIGSRRYGVDVRGQGGHSFGSFGRSNAIQLAAALICDIYNQPAPPALTTYNVGVIHGGTSVNTIAQTAHFLYEYRADCLANLNAMERRFREIIARHAPECVALNVGLLGERPCTGDVDPRAQAELVQRYRNLIFVHTGKQARMHASSCDCNIPLAAGIPSVCVGGYVGRGAHTQQEWVNLASLDAGIKLVYDILTMYT